MAGSEPPDPKAFARATGAEATASNSELKLQVRTLERKLRKMRGGTELILEAVHDAMDAPVSFEMPPPPKHSRKKSEEIAVLHISDTQIGKVTSSYDSTVADERIQKLARKTVEIADVRRNAATIRELHVYLGGDILEGEDVFPTQAHQIDQSVFDQALRTCPSILLRALLTLLGGFEKVKVCTVPGNHGRNGSRATRAHPRTNWDNVVYEALRLMLLGPEEHPRKDVRKRLEWVHSESFYVVDQVYDWGNLLVHGDQITGGFAGFPWYGAAKKAWGWIDSIPDPWDYLWFGHFHTWATAVLNMRTFLANGTTESGNEYAAAQLAAAGHPCQRLSFFSAEHGLIADHQVFLGGAGERVPARRRLG